MKLIPFEALQDNLEDIVTMCKMTGEAICLTRDEEMELIVVDYEVYRRREKILQLKESLTFEECMLNEMIDHELKEISEDLVTVCDDIRMCKK